MEQRPTIRPRHLDVHDGRDRGPIGGVEVFKRDDQLFHEVQKPKVTATLCASTAPDELCMDAGGRLLANGLQWTGGGHELQAGVVFANAVLLMSWELALRDAFPPRSRPGWRLHDSTTGLHKENASVKRAHVTPSHRVCNGHENCHCELQDPQHPVPCAERLHLAQQVGCFCLVVNVCAEGCECCVHVSGISLAREVGAELRSGVSDVLDCRAQPCHIRGIGLLVDVCVEGRESCVHG
mmetsp:Transcript_102746/g.314314  ORF Transcript_102746/g.314314 Transcript_102746/m.314314 type:complete len:238 (+) Transcript_102746:443-1156(+)